MCALRSEGGLGVEPAALAERPLPSLPSGPGESERDPGPVPRPRCGYHCGSAMRRSETVAGR